ncbi:hypothetical protein [Streptomyces sp. NRRL WC-3742]|uniref:hypothetical protein n=1 Tax=Streptomyces sp. NRRL WC-3742 TaxID=1463934 RepID=UPI0004CA6613|nr:hypothetical protein [Streptomyces sp. NRRL WC-3742]
MARGSIETVIRLCDFTVNSNPAEDVIGWAECRGDNGTCTWKSGKPVAVKVLGIDMAKHNRDIGHTAFVRHLTDHVTVTPESPSRS